MEIAKELIGIYHEQQQGALCAQHALNNLLQSSVFTADDLAVIARELDKEETDVLPFNCGLSENVDDTGFFNIQVLQRALTPFELELVPFGSQEPIAQQARSNPLSIQAYICNLGAHWFTIRRFARFYFDLNSIYYVPQLLSNEYLPSYLNHVEQNGYSVFVVKGKLEPTLADRQLEHNPGVLLEYQSKTKDMPKLIMDGKVIGSSKDSLKNGRLSIRVPLDLYQRLKKNPNDQDTQQLIMASLPEEFSKNFASEKSGKPPALLIVCDQDSEMNELVMSRCNCEYCQQYHNQQLLPSDPSYKEIINRSKIDISKRLEQNSRVMVMRTTQVLVDRPIPNDSNVSSQHRNTANTAIDDNQRQRITVIMTEQTIPTMNSSHSQIDSMEDIDLGEAIARSLLDQGPLEEIDDSVIREAMKKEYQESFDKLYAMNLQMRDINESHAKAQKRLTTGSSSISTKNSEPTRAPMASIEEHVSSETNSASSISNESFSTSTNKPVTPPSTPTVNPSLPDLINKSTVPSINTSVPITAIPDPPQPIVPDSTPPITPMLETTMTTNQFSLESIPKNSIASPSIEELRQSRLRKLGNRDRSIISVQSNYDD